MSSTTEGPPSGYSAVFWFLEMVAFSFVLVAVEQGFERHWGIAALAAVGGIAIATAGIKWPSLQALIVSRRSRSRGAPRGRDLGLYDHAINFSQGTASAAALLGAANEQIDRINQKVISHSEKMGRTTDLHVKRKKLDAFARNMSPDVQALETTAAKLKEKCDITVVSYLSVFGGVPIASSSEVDYLVGQALSMERAAPNFERAVKGLTNRREIMRQMKGHTETLNKISDRYLASLTVMIDAMERLRAFAASEATVLIRGRVGRLKYWSISRRLERARRASQ